MLNLDRFPTDPDFDGLLLFAQLVVEMLNDFTIDSNKAPLHNTRSRLVEAYEVLTSVETGSHPVGNLSPVVEELAWSIEEDLVVKSQLGPSCERIITMLRTTNLKKASASGLSGLRSKLDYLAAMVPPDEYRRKTRELLTEAIKEPKQKDRIAKLTQVYVTDLVHGGYSRRFIYDTAMEYFFSAGEVFGDIDETVRDFMDVFSFEERNWEVIIPVDGGYRKLISQKSERKDGAWFTEERPAPRTNLPEEAMFLGYPHPKYNKKYPILFIYRGFEALDPFVARVMSERVLDLLANIRQYHLHREPAKRQREVLAYDDTGRCVVIKPQVPTMNVGPDVSKKLLKSRIGATIRTILDNELGEDSRSRLMKVMNAHSQAVASRSSASQLLLLWSALESLLPRSKDDSRVAHMGSLLEPLLVRRYVFKLVHALEDALRMEIGEVLDDVLNQVTAGSNSTEKLAVILAVASLKPLRERLYTAVGHNVLLRNRIFQLKGKFESPESLMAVLEAHTRRVRWHLQRVYRARNAVIHDAAQIELGDVLVENLHSYVDLAVDTVLNVVQTVPLIGSIESVFIHLELEYNFYIASLKKSKNDHLQWEQPTCIPLLFPSRA